MEMDLDPDDNTRQSRRPQSQFGVSQAQFPPSRLGDSSGHHTSYYGMQGAPPPPLQREDSTNMQTGGTGSYIQGDPYDGDEGDSPDDGGLGDPNDPKKSRACEACRGLKVRCDQDPNHPELPCKRCAKARRHCIITPPNRKRTKKTDSRVAELEKKIDALTASLMNSQNKEYNGDEPVRRDPSEAPSDYRASGPARAPSPSVIRRQSEDTRIGGRNDYAVDDSGEEEPRRGDTRMQEPPPQKKRLNLKRRDSGSEAGLPPHTVNEEVEKVIDFKTATRVFDRYVEEMIPHWPIVSFLPGTTAYEVVSSKPTLFLSILVAASVGLLDIHVQQELTLILMRVFANSIIRNGEKSLELVQALMLAVVWYRPPRRYEQMNFYQLGHIAAVMAIDLGMGRKANTKAWRMAVVPEHVRAKTFDSTSVEARRTWLACYFTASHNAMTLRRPNLIRWSSFMDESIEILETSPSALPSDRLLCQHLKLQHIVEQIGNQFMMDDPSANVNIVDTRVQYALKGLEQQVQAWRSSVPKDAWTLSLQYSEYTTILYLHEIALHRNHNIDDFKAPFTEESLKAASGNADVLSPGHSSAIVECVRATKGLFDTFFSFDQKAIRGVPIFYFVRVAYAVVVLVKLHFAVTIPGSEIAQIISNDDLQTEYYLDRLLQVFHSVAEEDSFRPANKFLIMLSGIRGWFQKNKIARANQDRAEDRISSFPTSSAHRQQTEASPAQQRQMSTSGLPPQNVSNPNSSPYYPKDSGVSKAGPAPMASMSMPPHTSPQGYPNPAPRMRPGFSSPPHPSTPPGWYPSGSNTPIVHGYTAHQQQQIENLSNIDPNMSVDYALAGNTGFEQAIDLALGTGSEAEFNTMFMGDPNMFYGGGDGNQPMQQPPSNYYGGGGPNVGGAPGRSWG